eukprot:gene10820-10976_t
MCGKSWLGPAKCDYKGWQGTRFLVQLLEVLCIKLRCKLVMQVFHARAIVAGDLELLLHQQLKPALQEAEAGPSCTAGGCGRNGSQSCPGLSSEKQAGLSAAQLLLPDSRDLSLPAAAAAVNFLSDSGACVVMDPALVLGTATPEEEALQVQQQQQALLGLHKPQPYHQKIKCSGDVFAVSDVAAPHLQLFATGACQPAATTNQITASTPGSPGKVGVAHGLSAATSDCSDSSCRVGNSPVQAPAPASGEKLPALLAASNATTADVPSIFVRSAGSTLDGCSGSCLPCDAAAGHAVVVGAEGGHVNRSVNISGSTHSVDCPAAAPAAASSAQFAEAAGTATPGSGPAIDRPVAGHGRVTGQRDSVRLFGGVSRGSWHSNGIVRFVATSACKLGGQLLGKERLLQTMSGSAARLAHLGQLSQKAVQWRQQRVVAAWHGHTAARGAQGISLAAAASARRRSLVKRCLAHWAGRPKNRALLTRVFQAAEAAWEARARQQEVLHETGPYRDEFQLLHTTLRCWQLHTTASLQAAATRAAELAATIFYTRRLSASAWQRWQEWLQDQREPRQLQALAERCFSCWRQYVVAKVAGRPSSLSALRKMLLIKTTCTSEQKWHKRQVLCKVLQSWAAAVLWLPISANRHRLLTRGLSCWQAATQHTLQLLQQFHKCWHHERLLCKALVLWRGVVVLLRQQRQAAAAAQEWHSRRGMSRVVAAWLGAAAESAVERAASLAAYQCHAAQLMRRMLRTWSKVTAASAAARCWHQQQPDDSGSIVV